MYAFSLLVLTLAVPGPDTSLIVSARWLSQHIADPDVVVLDVRHEGMGGDFTDGHIKGARQLDYNDIGRSVNGINLELPTPEAIKSLFEGLGVSDNSHVVITGAPLMATRTFFTLDYFGLKRVSILAGGLAAWQAVGGVVEKGGATPRAHGHLTPHPRPEVVASADYVLSHIGKHGTSFIDTRTEGEYLGTSARHGLESAGHVQGARLLEWQNLFTNPDEFTPKDMAWLKQQWAELVPPGDSVVTYCAIGYRASGSYFFSRYLGYPVKLFDGSYEEWSRKNLPTVKTVTPPLPAAHQEDK